MLNLGEAADQTFATASTWKVLVYDKFCQASGQRNDISMRQTKGYCSVPFEPNFHEGPTVVVRIFARDQTGI